MSVRQFLPINNSGAVFLDDPHLRTPYVYQYNLSLQRNLFADMVLETNYVGTSGKGLTSLKDINPMVLIPQDAGTQSALRTAVALIVSASFLNSRMYRTQTTTLLRPA